MISSILCSVSRITNLQKFVKILDLKCANQNSRSFYSNVKAPFKSVSDRSKTLTYSVSAVKIQVRSSKNVPARLTDAHGVFSEPKRTMFRNRLDGYFHNKRIMIVYKVHYAKKEFENSNLKKS